MVVALALATGAITGTVGLLSERYGWNVPNYRNITNPLSGDANVEGNAFARANAILREEEGYRTTAYLDSRGKLTIGIGHLVLAKDGIKLGQTISDAQVEAFFAVDAQKAFQAAIRQAKECSRYNVEMIARLTSVNFQLGTNWTSEFVNTWSLIKSGKSVAAIKKLQASAWAQQTPQRVAAFVTTLQNQFA